MTMRTDGRQADELRPIAIETCFQPAAAGSVLLRWGGTVVLCSASVEEKVPPFRESSGEGWLTAEYNMLPGSTSPRKSRRSGGRESEIQRLIGRALRAATDLTLLGKRTITIDCDVISADGGTRVASITGGWIALALAVDRLRANAALEHDPVRSPVAAVSVGIVDGAVVLDLPYAEDSRADVDMNIVMTAAGRYIEVQGTAEHGSFSANDHRKLQDLAWHGIEQLCRFQQQVRQRSTHTAGAAMAATLER